MSNDANTSEGIILNAEAGLPLNNIILSPSSDDNSDKNINNVLNNMEMLQSSLQSNNLSDREIIINQNSSQDNTLTKSTSKSGVINIPTQSIKNEPQMEFKSNSTLNESVYTTINRDFKLMYEKLKYVINPFISKEKKEKKYNHIRQWDLWGPLLLNLILACTLTFNTKDKSQITTLIFLIFWMGGFVIYLNNHFLGVRASIFQMFCLLGYCLFPLNLAAIIVSIIKLNDIFRIIIVGLNLFWSIYSSSDYLKAITTQEQRYLVLYPCILFYLYIAWFIFTTKE